MIFLAWNILHNFFHPALQNPAQVIDGGGVERLVFPQLVDGGAGDAVVLDEGVGRFGGSSECGPKRCVRYHYSASCGVIMLSYDVFFNLTIVGKKTIMKLGGVHPEEI